MSNFFYKPTKKDIDELDNKLKRQTDKLKENKRRINAKLEFKKKTGLIGPELKEAFEEYWNNTNKKDRSPSPPPKKTKKQLALEAKEAQEAKEREILEKEAMEKQLMALKKFEPNKYNEIMGLSKPDTKNEELKKEIKEDKPKKINIKKGNKAKKQLEVELREKNIDIEKEHKKLLKEQKRLSTEKDLGEIMKGEAELLKKGKKYSIDTKLDVKKGLNKTIKNALKKSVLAELEKAIEGSGIYYDSSSSDSDSDNDEEDEIINKVKKLNNISKETLNNIKRNIQRKIPFELNIENSDGEIETISYPNKNKADKKDYKDAKLLIDNMKKVKRGRGRPVKYY